MKTDEKTTGSTRQGERRSKKRYVKPRILSMEKLEVVAVACNAPGSKSPTDDPFVCRVRNS